MYYSIFPTKTTYISSGSHVDTGVDQKDQNFGGSEVLELKKVFKTLTFDHHTRMLLQFNLKETGNSISQSIVEGKIPNPNAVVADNNYNGWLSNNNGVMKKKPKIYIKNGSILFI